MCRRLHAGLVCLVGLKKEDSSTATDIIVKKILNSRIFENPDSGGSWKKSVVDVDGEILCVSQFTLYGRLKSAKSDYSRAMPPAQVRQPSASFFGNRLSNAD